MIKSILATIRSYLVRRKVRRTAAAVSAVYETLGEGLKTFSPIAEETIIVVGQVAAAAANDPKVEAAVAAVIEAFGPHVAAFSRRFAAMTTSPEMAATMAAAMQAAQRYAAACASLVTAVMPDAPEQE